MEKEIIKNEIITIQQTLGMKDNAMANFMGVSVNTYKNCKSDKIERNNFNINNLETLKENISKALEKILK